MIYIAADHRGFELKAKINEWLKGRGFTFEDLGAYEHISGDDFVDFAIDVGQKVAVSSENNRGILICGSGAGMEIAANKVKGVRAGLGFVQDQVYAARKDDNINILVLAADNTDEMLAVELVEKFLETEFVKSENYLRRVEKITRYETESGHVKRAVGRS
jgi:RpiB/LacA/LacB family sugar-phosphate isomerase